MNFSARPTPATLLKYTPPATTSNPSPASTIGTIWVEFLPDISIGVKHLRAFAQTVASNNFHTGIVVTQNAITPMALKIIPTVLPSIIETFVEQDLLVNITHHELVPKHVVLSREDNA